MSKTHELDRMVLLVRDLLSQETEYEDIVRAFQRCRVLCKADKRNLASHSGQTALVTFVSLIARMGAQVFLDIPEIRVVGRQCPLRGNLLKEGLIDLGRDLISGTSIYKGQPEKPDMVFVLGDTVHVEQSIPSWRIGGGPWTGHIVPLNASISAWDHSWPVGSMTAAAMAAGEVFKAIVRPLQSDAGRLENLLCTMTPNASWDFGDDCPVPENVDCGVCDFISAGAINQSLLYALLRIPGMKLKGRVFDDDITDHTNLNRNMLTRRSDVGTAKICVARCFAKEDIIGVHEKVTGQTLKWDPIAESVLIGTDHIPSRWDVQKASKGWVGIAGTSHFGVLTSSHTPGQPCGGCLHWKDDLLGQGPIPTTSFISFWAGLSLAVRFLREKIGYGYGMNHQALWLVPLRIDEENAALWRPVAARTDCPVKCEPSLGIRAKQYERTLQIQ